MKYFPVKRIVRKLQRVFKNISATQRRRHWRHVVKEVLKLNPQVTPLTLIDIGASGDLPEHWMNIEKYLRVIGFEPDKKAHEELVAKAEQHRVYLPLALAEKTGESDFFITRKQMVSSMLRPNRKLLDEFPHPNRFDIVETIKMKTDTLDTALYNENADFIKLDTQGSELFILQGASETLSKKLLGVEVEVEFTEMYEHQPLFGEVDSFLRQSGFVLLGFIQISQWKRKSTQIGKGQTMFADALYIKSKEVLDDKTKLLKAALICILYGYDDYAASLLQEGLHKKIIEEHEYQRIVNA